MFYRAPGQSFFKPSLVAQSLAPYVPYTPANICWFVTKQKTCWCTIQPARVCLNLHPHARHLVEYWQQSSLSSTMQWPHLTATIFSRAPNWFVYCRSFRRTRLTAQTPAAEDCGSMEMRQSNFRTTWCSGWSRCHFRRTNPFLSCVSLVRGQNASIIRTTTCVRTDENGWYIEGTLKWSWSSRHEYRVVWKDCVSQFFLMPWG